MRELSICHEAKHHNQTETKKKGRRTGASPAVLFMPRMDGSRSDLPPLFNQNPFIMREPMDKCATCADKPLTAETIIDELISRAEMAYFEQGLHDLFIAFINQDEVIQGDYKDTAVFTYISLRNLIKEVDQLKNLQKS